MKRLVLILAVIASLAGCNVPVESSHRVCRPSCPHGYVCGCQNNGECERPNGFGSCEGGGTAMSNILNLLPVMLAAPSKTDGLLTDLAAALVKFANALNGTTLQFGFWMGAVTTTLILLVVNAYAEKARSNK